VPATQAAVVCSSSASSHNLSDQHTDIFCAQAIQDSPLVSEYCFYRNAVAQSAPCAICKLAARYDHHRSPTGAERVMLSRCTRTTSTLSPRALRSRCLQASGSGSVSQIPWRSCSCALTRPAVARRQGLWTSTSGHQPSLQRALARTTTSW
jgi:hypothetical protein